MSATRSGVLERLRNKGLSGPSLSCTSVLQMRRVDHLESALWRDAYRAEFSTQIGQSRAEFGARVGARRSRQTFTGGFGWKRLGAFAIHLLATKLCSSWTLRPEASDSAAPTTTRKVHMLK